MEPDKLDTLARMLGGPRSRRGAVGMLALSLLQIARQPDGAFAKRKKKKKCKNGTIKCKGRCINAQSDPENCGACGVTCGGRACVNGVCQSPGGGGCPAGQICVSSHCQCDVQNGYQSCGNGCTQIRSDPENCGRCGRACFSDAPVCLINECCVAEAQTCSRSFLDSCCSRYCGTDQRCHACGSHADCHEQGLPEDEICLTGRCCRPGGTRCSGRGYPCCSGICDPVAPPGVGHVCR